MFKTQVMINASFCFISTLWDPTFLLLVLSLRWSENEVSGMFQYLATFHKEVCVPSPLHPYHFLDPFGHLDHLIALCILLIWANLYISTMGGWHWCCVGVWTDCDLEVFCIVGVTRVIGCGGWFSCFTQVVLEMPLCCFHGTFKCVAM
jgi:hypothetical protein